MTQTHEKAVFLSYASQDADAVQHIVDALRAGGLEVWFDMTELVGGDAWDRKIRKQIKDCSLFIPVISANTQARGEGYFRLEWHLAEQRSQLIAKGQPFIVPVSFDGLRENEALVPDAFTEVQWTAISRDAVPAEFVVQIQRLLAKQEGSETPVASDGKPKMSDRIPARPRRTVLRIWVISVFCVTGLALAIKFIIGSNNTGATIAVQHPPTTAASQTVEDRFIAVLPFTSQSADDGTAKSNEFFAQGVHENILTQLSNIPDLRVVSRTSVMQYKDNVASIPQIRAELGVSHILEGSVQRVGKVVQVNVQLIDARTDSRLWTKSFERDVINIFEIQAEIAKAVAAELKTVLTPEQQQEIERLPTENKEALALFINASAMNWFNEQELKAAIVLLEKAIKLDPNFAEAYVRLARLYSKMIGSRESGITALGYAQKAVALNPNSATAQHALAVSYLQLGKSDEARIGFQRAIELDPNFDKAMKDLSILEARSGKFDQTFYWANRAMPLAPNVSYSYYHVAVPLLYLDIERTRKLLHVAIEKFSPPNRSDSGVHRLQILLAAAELYDGQAKAAMKRFDTLIAAQPNNMEVRATYAEMCWLIQRDCAQPQVDFFLKEFPGEALTAQGYSARTLQAYLWQQGSQSAQAQRLIASTIAANEQDIKAGNLGFGPANENAALSYMKGDREGALTWLERAVDAGYCDPYSLALDPILAPLANEPRFKQLLKRQHEDLRNMRARVDFSDVDAMIAAGSQAPLRQSKKE